MCIYIYIYIYIIFVCLSSRSPTMLWYGPSVHWVMQCTVSGAADVCMYIYIYIRISIYIYIYIYIYECPRGWAIVCSR